MKWGVGRADPKRGLSILPFQAVIFPSNQSRIAVATVGHFGSRGSSAKPVGLLADRSKDCGTCRYVTNALPTNHMFASVWMTGTSSANYHGFIVLYMVLCGLVAGGSILDSARRLLQRGALSFGVPWSMNRYKASSCLRLTQLQSIYKLISK